MNCQIFLDNSTCWKHITFCIDIDLWRKLMDNFLTLSTYPEYSRVSMWIDVHIIESTTKKKTYVTKTYLILTWHINNEFQSNIVDSIVSSTKKRHWLSALIHHDIMKGALPFSAAHWSTSVLESIKKTIRETISYNIY